MEYLPLVSIICTAYNHETFIKDALEGFVMQKTNFPFEIIISDDASTDKTASIIKQYEINHTQLFKTFYHKENQYSKNIPFFYDELIKNARGKYIALCEGDDYWTDPLKLQKQVDFLEVNEDFGIVHADCNYYIEKINQWEYHTSKNLTNNFPIKNKKDIFYRLIDATYKIRTATAVFRKDLLEKIKPDDLTFLMGDTPMWLNFSQLTNFKYFDEVFAVYRIVGESASRSKNKNKQFRFSLSMAEMRVYYSKKFSYPINDSLKTRYNDALMTYKLFNNNYKEIFPLFEPSIYQHLKLKALNINILRHYFLFSFIIFNYLQLIKNKIRLFKFANRTSPR